MTSEPSKVANAAVDRPPPSPLSDWPRLATTPRSVRSANSLSTAGTIAWVTPMPAYWTISANTNSAVVWCQTIIRANPIARRTPPARKAALFPMAAASRAVNIAATEPMIAQGISQDAMSVIDIERP